MKIEIIGVLGLRNEKILEHILYGVSINSIVYPTIGTLINESGKGDEMKVEFTWGKETEEETLKQVLWGIAINDIYNPTVETLFREAEKSKKKKKINRITRCIYCDEALEKYSHRIVRWQQFFCSYECCKEFRETIGLI